MKLKDFLERINTLVEINPEVLDYSVVYSSDDEGNVIDYVHYSPSVILYDKEERSAVDECDIPTDTGEFIKVVCIN